MFLFELWNPKVLKSFPKMGVPYLIIFAFLMAFLNEAPPPIYSYGFDWTKLKKTRSTVPPSPTAT